MSLNNDEEEITKYLTIIPLEENFQISFTGNYTPQYSYNGSDWDDWTSDVVVSINMGTKLYVKGNLPENTKCGSFATTQRFNLSGNCNSMIFGDDTENEYANILTNYNNVFESLFYNCPVVGISEGFLPAHTLGNYCYYKMFQNCTSLIKTHALPATTLATYCYANMFENCTSLVTAPDLPATTLATYCYSTMFKGCTSLFNAPRLQATTLASHCYRYMFQNCTSLTAAPTLPATTLSPYCYYGMFYGCTSLIRARIYATTLSNSCCIQMFQNCTSLVTAPDLPAKTLATYCYQQMFAGCSSLVNAPALPATTLINYCYMAMFQNCTSLVKAPELPASPLKNYCYYMMFYGCSKLSYIKALFTHTPTTTYMSNWVNGVASTGTFVKSKNAAWSDVFGTSAIPVGWNVLTEGYEDNYMTIEALEDGLTAKLSLNTCEYSTDALNWETLTADTYTPSINTGEKLYFKGNITPVANKGVGTFTITKRCNLKGNCNSLLFGDDAATNMSLAGKDYAFHYLFNNCSTIVSVSENFIPATEISNSCYMNMFTNCTSLTNTPKLPATILYQYCYANMFSGCSALTSSIAFDSHNSSNKVTTAPWCCGYMFTNCTSLKTGKTPYCETGLAVNKTSNCFNSMFRGCSRMNRIYALFPVSMIGACRYWVENVASSGTFYTLDAVDWTSDSSNIGINGYPENWSVVTVA